MTYNTPELVQIGAAQNLVLFEPSEQPGCLRDNIVTDRSFLEELW